MLSTPLKLPPTCQTSSLGEPPGFPQGDQTTKTSTVRQMVATQGSRWLLSFVSWRVPACRDPRTSDHDGDRTASATAGSRSDIGAKAVECNTPSRLFPLQPH